LQGAKFLLFLKIGQGLLRKTKDLGKKAIELRPKKIGPLGKQAIEGIAGIDQAGLLAMKAKGHLRQAGTDLQLFEKTDKIRVGCLIKDDKAGIHRYARIRAIGNGNGMGMPPQIIALLEQAYLMGFLQQMGSNDTGNSPSYHGDLSGHGIMCLFHYFLESWVGGCWLPRGNQGKKALVRAL